MCEMTDLPKCVDYYQMLSLKYTLQCTLDWDTEKIDFEISPFCDLALYSIVTNYH